MGLAGDGPRDWTPGDASGASSGPGSNTGSGPFDGWRAPDPRRMPPGHGYRLPDSSTMASVPGYRLPGPVSPMPPEYVATTSGRVAVWAIVALGLIAMSTAVIVIGAGQIQHVVFTSIGITAFVAGLRAEHLVKHRGYRGNLIAIRLGMGLGILATVIMAVTFVTVLAAPGLLEALHLRR